MCPVCGGELAVRGQVMRTVILTDGNKAIFIIRRLYCRGCRRSHRELPDIITPYKRHCTETIEHVLGGNGRETPCEDSTIRRIRSWWLELKPYFLGVLLSLELKLGVSFPAPAPIKAVIRAVVNSGGWICTRSACLSP